MERVKNIGDHLLVLHNKLTALNKFYSILFIIALFAFFSLASLLNKISLSQDKEIKITVITKVQRNDIFYLFYLPVSQEAYSDTYTLPMRVSGKDEYQYLSFNLPDSIKIKELRLDLGNDTLQKEVLIKSIFLTYNNQQLVLFNGAAGSNYFKANEFVAIHNHNHFSLNPPQKEIYDPYIYSKDLSTEYRQLLLAKNGLPFPYFISFIVIFSFLVYVLIYSRINNLMQVFYTCSSCFFIFALLLPSLSEKFGTANQNNLEKRELASKPAFNLNAITEYPKLYEAYYNDNFGLRNLLIKLGGKIKYTIFNSSSVPSKAAVGKEGWLFLTGSFYKVKEDLLRQNLYTPFELEAAVQEWRQKKEELASDSIKFFKAVWPDKHYIYPELMPYGMQVLRKDTMSRCDQLIKYLRDKKSDLHLIDVRGLLMKEKSKTQVYEKYDSHWNANGAFIAYTELIKEINKEIPALEPIPLKNFDVHWESDLGGDLNQILGLELAESKPVYTLKGDSVQVKQLPIDGFPERTVIFHNEKAATNLTALIYRDSFTTALMPFLNYHFKKIVFLSNVPYSNDMVKKVNPNVVIECYATRYFR